MAEEGGGAVLGCSLPFVLPLGLGLTPPVCLPAEAGTEGRGKRKIVAKMGKQWHRDGE